MCNARARRERRGVEKERGVGQLQLRKGYTFAGFPKMKAIVFADDIVILIYSKSGSLISFGLQRIREL